MPNTGTILHLNGPSSAGKSSLALAIQRTMSEPFLHVGIDVIFDALDGTWLPTDRCSPIRFGTIASASPTL